MKGHLPFLTGFLLVNYSVIDSAQMNSVLSRVDDTWVNFRENIWAFRRSEQMKLSVLSRTVERPPGRVFISNTTGGRGYLRERAFKMAIEDYLTNLDERYKSIFIFLKG